jgi:hypothetical protein
MNAFPFEVIEGGAKPASLQGLRDRLPKGAAFPYYWANIDDDEQMTLYEAAYVLLEDGTKHQLWCETFMDGQRRCDISVVHVGDDEIEDVDQEWAKEMYFQLLGEVEERLRDARALAPVPERTLVNAALPRLD